MINELDVAVIHDIKNQLAQLALMLERRGDCQQEKAIAFAASKRLSTLLLAHLQQDGMLKAHVDTACPADLLEDVASEYRSLFPNLDIDVDDAEAPPFWFYDTALLRLALENALHNACRHAGQRVSLKAVKSGDRLHMTVADDGPGFSEDMLLLNAGETPMPASRNGTGLGLYLAAHIAQLHENSGECGTIFLENRDGAVFTLSLP